MSGQPADAATTDAAQGLMAGKPPAAADAPAADPTQGLITADNLLYHDLPATLPEKEAITFAGVEQIDRDIDLDFRLRGHSLNPLVDAATPLFGLVIRARRMTDHRQIPQLYVRVRDEITVILEEIKQRGYDGPTQLAYSYCLCAYVDEAIMATAWGAHSIWAERSMLSIYHNETWGGEKFFTILSRMMLEPENYRDMLALGYYCLSLGFRGKYGVQFDGAAQLQAILRKLHQTLRNLHGDPAETLTNSYQQVRPTPYRFDRQTPLWSVWAVSGTVLLMAYVVYATKLMQLTGRAMEQLSALFF